MEYIRSQKELLKTVINFQVASQTANTSLGVPENLKIQNHLPTAHAGCEIGRKESSASHENHFLADIPTASFLNNYVIIIHQAH